MGDGLLIVGLGLVAISSLICLINDLITREDEIDELRNRQAHRASDSSPPQKPTLPGSSGYPGAGGPGYGTQGSHGTFGYSGQRAGLNQFVNRGGAMTRLEREYREYIEAARQLKTAHQAARALQVNTTSPLPLKNASLPHKGIHVGEIKAWRIWKVVGGNGERVFPTEFATPRFPAAPKLMTPETTVSIRHYPMLLKSYTQEINWDPEAPMQGDPSTGFGVFAYSDEMEMQCEWGQAVYERSHHDMMQHLRGDRSGPMVLIGGTCDIWGEVVVHERGYRAEFARPTGFTHVFHSQGPTSAREVLKTLREVYKVDQPEESK